jgi:hypothetical protein
LNQNIIVDGHRVHYAQLDAQINMKWNAWNFKNFDK